jgi:putative tricarboxylic transport membrane protein
MEPENNISSPSGAPVSTIGTPRNLVLKKVGDVLELLIIGGGAGFVLLQLLYRQKLLFNTWVWPVLIVALIVVGVVGLAAAQCYRHLRRIKANPYETMDFSNPWERYIIMSLFLLYALGLPLLGYALASLVFSLAAYFVLCERPRPKYVIVVISIVVFTYLIFDKLFGVPLPSGIGSVFGL